MAMKRVIDKLEDVAEHFRGEYLTDGAGKFTLIVDGDDDMASLRKQLDKEIKDRKELSSKLAKIGQEKEDAETAAIRATGDLAAINADYEKKLQKSHDDYKELVKSRDNETKNAKRKELALKIATEISTVPSVMERIVADRIHVDIVDGVAITRVLDADGKASAMSVDELKKEFVANKEYHPIIVASKASGGGAGSGGNGNQDAGSGAPTKLSEMTELERVAFLKRDKAGFIAMRDAEAKAARGF